LSKDYYKINKQLNKIRLGTFHKDNIILK